jgi:hypothetical protein
MLQDGLGQFKKSTSSGLEPAIFWLAAHVGKGAGV